MAPIRIASLIFLIALLCVGVSNAQSDEASELETLAHIAEPTVGSWTFSGMVTNESGERYGYFFYMKRQGSQFSTKTALIDGQTNQLVLFYEGNEQIDKEGSLNWKVGRSFIRYNPINDSWVFGVKTEDQKGFNFKVDMLNQGNKQKTQLLRPGLEMQAIQTSRLNGHIQIEGTKEEFVTGNNAWFARLWFSKDQKTAHDIHTTFCRLSNDNGFYSANLKEADATDASVAGWFDSAGNKVKMSQFIHLESLTKNQSVLHLGLPKMNLNIKNTLNDTTPSSSIAGFFKDYPQGFCFITQQSFAKIQEATESEIPSRNS